MTFNRNGSVIQGFFPNGVSYLAGRGATLQRLVSAKGDAFGLPTHTPPFAQQGGQPLPAAVRQQMESSFGASFADVRIHVDARAASIGALACTSGSHVYFGPGHYDPLSARGRQMLGHELAHVLQQRTGRVRNPFGSGVAVVHDAVLEAEARRLAQRAAAHVWTAPQKARVGQPLKYERWSGLFGYFRSAQQKRIDALEKRLGGEIDARIKYFTNKAGKWIGDHNALWTLQDGLNKIRKKTYAEEDYNEIENQLRDMLSKFSSGYDKWLPADSTPQDRFTNGITETGNRIFEVNGSSYDLNTTIGKEEFVEVLFKRFIAYGFRYHAQAFIGSNFLLGEDKQAGYVMLNPNTLERFGSCVGLSIAFASLLNQFDGITAKSTWVMGEHQYFMAKVPKFIDPTVGSNVEFKGQKCLPYLVFKGHQAVKVEGIDLIWDPMAKEHYQWIEPSVECRLNESQDGSRMDIIGTCKTFSVDGPLVSGQHFYLQEDPNRTVGGLRMWKLMKNP